VVVEHEEFADVAELFPPEAEDDAEEKAARSKDGYVYLIQWGEVFKIGRGQYLEKRVKQVHTGLPDSGKLVHAIRTDDPPGIEAYCALTCEIVERIQKMPGGPYSGEMIATTANSQTA
jgi:hypothetical protein